MRLVTKKDCGTLREYLWVDRALVPLEDAELCLVSQALQKIMQHERKRMLHELILYGRTNLPNRVDFLDLNYWNQPESPTL